MIARSGIDQIMGEIMKLEEHLKKNYGRTAGMVRIANARTTTSYSVSKSEEYMKWHVEYLSNLRNQL
jgi:hypothetical protein